MDDSWRRFGETGRAESSLSNRSSFLDDALTPTVRRRALNGGAHSSQTQRILRQLEKISTPAKKAARMNLGSERVPGLGSREETATPGRLRGPPLGSASRHSLLSARPYHYAWRNSENSSRSSTPSSHVALTSAPDVVDSPAPGKLSRKAAATFSARYIAPEPLPYDLDVARGLALPATSGGLRPGFLSGGRVPNGNAGDDSVWDITGGPTYDFSRPFSLSSGPRAKAKKAKTGKVLGVYSIAESPVKTEPLEDGSPNSASSSSATEDHSSSWKDGDWVDDGKSWNCRECSFRNEPSHADCFQCRLPKRPGKPEPSITPKAEVKWECAKSKLENAASVTRCVCCSTEKGAALPPPPVSASWSCPDCCVSNKAGVDKCACCGAANAKAKPAAKWSCPDCCVSNAANAASCACCGATKPGAAPSAPKAKSKWSCGDCMVGNDATADKCVCCGAANPSAPTKSAAPKPFGSSGLKLEASSQFTFGFGSGAKGTEKPTTTPAFAPTTKGLSFDLAAPAATPPKSLFGFGAATPKPAAVGSSSSKLWNCTTCFVSNPGTAAACVACQSNKPGTSFNPISFGEKRSLDTSDSKEPSAKKSVHFNDAELTTTKIITGRSFEGKPPSTTATTLFPPLSTPAAPIAFPSSLTSATAAPLAFPKITPSSEKSPATMEVPKSEGPSTTAPKVVFGIGTSEAKSSPAPAEPPKSVTVSATLPLPTSNLFGVPAASEGTPKLGGKRTLDADAPAPKLAALPTSGFSFGLPKTTAAEDKPTKTPVAPVLFGAAKTDAPAAAPFGSFSFGSSSKDAAPLSSSLFGAQPTTTAPSTSSLFGAKPATDAPTTMSSSLFGAKPSTDSSSSLFGAKTETPSANSSTNNLFGIKGGEGGSSSSLFGMAKAPETTSTGGIFGTPKAPTLGTNTSTPLFGAPSLGKSESTNSLGGGGGGLFGGSSSTMTFGVPAVSAPPPAFPAPAVAPAPGGGFDFGGAAAGGAPAFQFGAAPTATGTISFGASASDGTPRPPPPGRKIVKAARRFRR